jgi:phosphatidylserine/phosphatidylglycerophosphate/cardiolipin synthase-like enzyme
MKAKTLTKFAPMWFIAAAVMMQPASSEAAEVAAAFSPGIAGTTAEALVIETIDSARQSIRLAAYYLTSKPIAQALVDAKRRGVDVKAVLDKENLVKNYSGAHYLANSDIPVRIDSEYATMHNKFMVVDSQTVQTGSFNYTEAATRANAENVIVVRNHASFAQEYDAEWLRLWRESEPLQRRN